nr:GNAT family N-acetyltransferase [uncultured Desulfobulbus sp.]
MHIQLATRADYPELLELWEASVRATHDFITDTDIQELKPLILHQYFDTVDLRCIKSDIGKILGFSGVHEGSIAMLFISPEARGKGIGTLLVIHAIKQQQAWMVDVNEQNIQALGFYLHRGFLVTGRSPLDGQGKPHPLLHMVVRDESVYTSSKGS